MSPQNFSLERNSHLGNWSVKRANQWAMIQTITLPGVVRPRVYGAFRLTQLEMVGTHQRLKRKWILHQSVIHSKLSRFHRLLIAHATVDQTHSWQGRRGRVRKVNQKRSRSLAHQPEGKRSTSIMKAASHQANVAVLLQLSKGEGHHVVNKNPR